MFRIIMTIIGLVLGMVGFAPAAVANSASETETMVLNKPQVLKSTASFIGKSKKVKVCKAYAAKLEQQAPPRDPHALCEGSLKVSLKGVARSAKCPEGWFGGRATLRVTLTQIVKARSFAKSIANGRVQTWARFKIRDKAKISGKATTECMRIPEEPEQPHDECPEIPGDQPEGYDCEPESEVPTASGNAKACVKPGEANGVITALGTNPNDVAAPGTLIVGGQTYQFPSVGAGQTVTRDFSGFAPGTYSGSFTLGSPINKSATFSVTVQQCQYQNGSIVEVTDINDVLYGNSRTWRIRGVVPNGQTAVLTVQARIGTVKESDKSITLGSGAFDLTITYTAPTEGTSDTLTAILYGPDGVIDSQASDTFELRNHAPNEPL